jgi:hypothetical protein
MVNILYCTPIYSMFWMPLSKVDNSMGPVGYPFGGRPIIIFRHRGHRGVPGLGIQLRQRAMLRMTFSELEARRIQKLVGEFIEKRRPSAHIRSLLDLGFRVRGQSIEVFEIRPVWQNPNERIEEPVAKATYDSTRRVWAVYWQRGDLTWCRYDPDPEVKALEAFIELLDDDRHACFFG